MSGEKDIEQLKKEAAAKAKEQVQQRLAEKQSAQATIEKDPKKETQSAEKSETENIDLAKAKAAAAAKAKAAALAKQKANEQTEATTEPVSVAPTAGDGDEKAKAIAAAKAKAAALAKQSGQAEAPAAGSGDEKAKAIAAAKAKAAAAAAAKAKAAAGAKTDGTAAPVVEITPSPNQQFLDKYVRVIEEHLGQDVIEESYINNLSKDVPTLVAKRDTYFKIAQFLKYNEQLGFDYLSEIHGSDFETHMEMYAHLYSYKNHQSVALKVKIDRDAPEIESLEPLWAGANWPECEAYDLLGINFLGHPKLHRIMLGEDWIGHPLRKDYVQYDVEV